MRNMRDNTEIKVVTCFAIERSASASDKLRAFQNV